MIRLLAGALALMSSLSPVQQAVLDKLASAEGAGYNSIYGGHKFVSFHEHPQIPVPLPAGKGFSTAAGRYQLTAPTWFEEKSKLGLSDFSPASQDAAAWHLAERTYRTKTGGRDLASDQAAGVTNWNALADRWVSLKARGPARPILDTMPQMTAPAPNPLTLSTQLIKPLQSLGPVQPSPSWNLTPQLVPVDHDPFQKEAANVK